MLTLRLILLSCLCAPLLSFSAEARESYLSSGVEVSKTASNSNEARRRAVSEAEQRAFREVAVRAFPQYREAMEAKPLDPKMASAAVTEMNINRETVTDRHYGGEFAIRFNPALMKEILRREYGSKAAAAAAAAKAAPAAPEGASETSLSAPAAPAKTAAKAVTVTAAAPEKAQAAKQEAAKAAAPKPATTAPKQAEAPKQPDQAKAEQPKTAKFTAVQPIAQQLPKPKSDGALVKLPAVLSPRPTPAAPAPSVRPVPPAAETFGLRPVPAERPAPTAFTAERAPRPVPVAPAAPGVIPAPAPAPERIASLPEVTFLPVLEQSDQALQWDQDNPWLSSWRKLSQEKDSFALPEPGAPVLHPLMLSFIAKRELQEVDRLRIQEGYPGARAGGKLFMATGKYYYSTEDKKPVIETTVYQISPTFRPGATTRTVKHVNETLDSLADRAAREAYSAYAGSSAPAASKTEAEPAAPAEAEAEPAANQQAAAPAEEPQAAGNPAGSGCAGSEVTEKLRAEAAQLQEWISVEKRLKTAEGIKSVRPLRLSPGNMQIEITHTCDAASLASSLVAAGLPYNAETRTIAQGTQPPEETVPETF